MSRGFSQYYIVSRHWQDKNMIAVIILQWVLARICGGSVSKLLNVRCFIITKDMVTCILFFSTENFRSQ